MERKTVSFDINQTSPLLCWEILIFTDRCSQLGQGSGTYDGRAVLLALPKSRKTLLVWEYIKCRILERENGILVVENHSGEGELWPMDIRVE
jgi:hypothetical protein